MPDCCNCGNKMKLLNFGFWYCKKCDYTTTFTEEELLEDVE